jgi:hypothetical protein
VPARLRWTVCCAVVFDYDRMVNRNVGDALLKIADRIASDLHDFTHQLVRTDDSVFGIMVFHSSPSGPYT